MGRQRARPGRRNYTIGAMSHRGAVRTVNQDSFGTPLTQDVDLDRVEGLGVLVAVADGMGGHSRGDVASQIAIRSLFRSYYASAAVDLDPHALGEQLRAAVIAANRAILTSSVDATPARRMGTTLVAAVLRGLQLTVANVGDSRGYLFAGRQRTCTQITTDHSWVAEQATAGLITDEQARQHAYRNVVTRALGQREHVAVDLFHYTLSPGAIVLLCSDGLSNMLQPTEFAEVLAALPAQQAAAQLVTLAVDRGSPDNITAVVVHTAHLRGQTAVRRSLLWLFLAAMLLAALALALATLWQVDLVPLILP